MASRDRNQTGKSGPFDFCIMQVLLSKKGAPSGIKDQVRLMTVDSHLETLCFVENNLETCVSNMVRLKPIQLRDK
jgi:hypothetical protein